MVSIFVDLPRDSQFDKCNDIYFDDFRAPARECFQAIPHLGPFCYEPDHTHDAEIDGGGRKPMRDLEARERVEEAVCGAPWTLGLTTCVQSLYSTWSNRISCMVISAHSRSRGLTSYKEQESATDPVDKGSIYHTTDMWRDLSALRDYTLNVSLISNVTLTYSNSDFKRAQVLDHLSSFLLSQADPGCLHDIPRSLMSHPATYGAANATCDACDKV